MWLKSGATLVIDKTEAMTVIDVNTAKAIAGKRSTEGTFLKTNLESAHEIPRRIRIRNVSGIIIIDFTDIKEKTSEEQLISHMKQLLADDPVRSLLHRHDRPGAYGDHPHQTLLKASMMRRFYNWR